MPAHSLDLQKDIKKLLGMREGIKYEMQFEGLSKDMLKYIQKLELDEPPHENYPQNLAELNLEAQSNGVSIKKALYAKGYYEAVVTTAIKPIEEGEDPIVLYTVTEGRRYRISDIRIEWQGAEADGYNAKLLQALIIKKGDPIDAELIQKASEYVRSRLEKRSCLFSMEVTPLLVKDENTASGAVVLQAKAGARASFGDVTIMGNEAVDKEVIERAIKWKEGGCYRSELMDDTQLVLLQTQLFSTASIKPASEPDAKGKVPVKIEVKERAFKTVRAGLNYITDRGVGVKLGWDHRNLWGGGEKLTSETFISAPDQYIKGTVTLPEFYHPKQNLNISGSIRKEDVDFYTVESADAGATVERIFTDRILGGAGVNYALSKVDQTANVTKNDTFGLLSFPLYAQWDNRNDLLDPRKGYYARGTVAPHINTLNAGLNFIKSQGEAQAYFTQSKWYWKPTLALRGATGSINGAGIEDIPADVLFHAGGGGSVRGYTYEALGPKQNGTPLGGISWLEFTTEVRLRFNETFGAAFFMDAGNVYDATFPQAGEKLYIGLGGGIRYYTPAGPLRLDVGIPINKDDDDDSSYAVYVSMGQAF